MMKLQKSNTVLEKANYKELQDKLQKALEEALVELQLRDDMIQGDLMPMIEREAQRLFEEAIRKINISENQKLEAMQSKKDNNRQVDDLQTEIDRIRRIMAALENELYTKRQYSDGIDQLLNEDEFDKIGEEAIDTETPQDAKDEN